LSTVNDIEVPDALPALELKKPAQGDGQPLPLSARHWDDTWSVDETHKAMKDHGMFTWGAADAVRGGAPLITRAEGVYLYDSDGKQYFDWTSEAVCSNMGYDVPPAVMDAITKQLGTVPFVYSGLALTEVRARISALMAEIVPGDITGFLFPSSGAEANEAAIRMARRFTGRHKIMTRQRSYHGGTAITLTATGDFRRAFEESSPGFIKIIDPNPTSFSWGDDPEEAGNRALAALREQIDSEGPSTIAAMLMEHIPGSAGVLHAPPGYMEGVRSICDEHGILLIADEVMTGFGRTGKMFGFEHFHVQPDIVTMAKGLTGSWLPLSAVGVSTEIHDHFRTSPLGYGSTFQGHPVALACGYEVLKHMNKTDVMGHVSKMEPVLKELMQGLVDEHACVRQVRSIGMFGAADLVETKGPNAGNRFASFSGAAISESAAKIPAFKKALHEEGVIAFFRNCLLHAAPPLVTTEPELRDAFGRVHKALRVFD